MRWKLSEIAGMAFSGSPVSLSRVRGPVLGSARAGSISSTRMKTRPVSVPTASRSPFGLNARAVTSYPLSAFLAISSFFCASQRYTWSPWLPVAKSPGWFGCAARASTFSLCPLTICTISLAPVGSSASFGLICQMSLSSVPTMNSPVPGKKSMALMRGLGADLDSGSISMHSSPFFLSRRTKLSFPSCRQTCRRPPLPPDRMSVTKVPFLSRLTRTRTAEQFFTCALSHFSVLILSSLYCSFLITCIVQSSPVDTLRHSRTLPSPTPVTHRISPPASTS
mmetsp:Transcript_20909/g.53129  ORF Transcript_20909/g.53129 Transcript_20909/m.53129 type:complete len:280 (-) Transcript_20909:1194-2033(-)